MLRRTARPVPSRRRPTLRPVPRRSRRRLRLDSLEARTLLSASGALSTATASSEPTWVSQGPGPETGGVAEGTFDTGGSAANPDNPVAGAIDAIAIDPVPADGSVVYVGAVGGGVWKTSDANDATPQWTPLSDSLPSLAISALAVDPHDPTGQTLYAGTGSVSAARDVFFATANGPAPYGAAGIYKTTDGGATWTVLNQDAAGDDVLGGKTVVAIAFATNPANGSKTVLAATITTSGNGGLYHSSDGGATWSEVTPADGLPAGNVTSVVSDPADASIAYAAVRGQGVFRSDDGGQTWAATTNSDLDINSGQASVRLAIAGHAVFAAVLSSGPAFGSAEFNGGQLLQLARSGDQGDTWVSMNLPQDANGVGLYPTNAAFYFSMMADPNDAGGDTVFVGGSFAPQFPYWGRHFRGVFSSTAPAMNNTQWQNLDGANANNTATHANSRAMVFDTAQNTVLEADEGGIYKLHDPANANNARQWSVMNGNLQVAEFLSVAYDERAGVVVGGSQDVGAGTQSAPGSQTWNQLPSNLVSNGYVVAVDNSGPGDVRYFTSHSMSTVWRVSYNASNQPVLPAEQVNLAAAGTPTVAGSGVLAADWGSIGPFPLVLNSVDPSRMLLGYHGLYESLATDASGNPALTGDVVQNVTPAAMKGTVTALAYGGRSASGDNPDVAFVGTSSGQLFVRTAAGGPFTPVTAYSGGAVRSIVLLPDDWQTAYVMDDANLYKITIAGQNAASASIAVTGNLGQLTSDFGSLAVYSPTHTPGDEVVLVGAVDGVYRTLDPNDGANAVWAPYGRSLPHVPVSDLHYDATSDLLLAGTAGRGAWTVADASQTLLPALQAVGGFTLGATEGVAAAAQTVATFADPAGLQPLDQYTATIDWGDGSSTSAGTVSFDSASQVFSVTAGHIYTEDGTDAIHVVIERGIASSVTATSTAVVSESPVTGSGATLTGTPSAELSAAVVATFSHGTGVEPASAFTASIDWGDGATAAGTVFESAGSYSVLGSHAYVAAGQYGMEVTISDDRRATLLAGSAVIGTPHQLYVTAVYHDVLGRAPDAGGLTYWSNLLDSGAAISSVAEAIAHSDEYYANFVIKPTYLKLLGRPADAAGVTYWTGQMDAGVTDQELEADLVSSAEFYNNAGGTNLAWIDAVYKLLLGRPADANGESFWTSQFAAGLTLNGAAQGIAGSQENNTQLINDDYFHYLGRPADTGGLNYWLAQFAAGKTNEDVIAGFTGSAEYYQEHSAPS
ncbi:MAG TPA: DUF4214 domain-containing protein [Pirellulales bacterium]|nr:DUF4214 domain-containing protein [Pirellulales bacterium]